MTRMFLSFTAGLGLLAQDSVQGPMVGWTYEASTASMRAIQGIPGSSTLGGRAGSGLRRGVSAPGGAFAVATLAETGEARLLDLRNGESRSLDVPEGADAIFFSPRGSAAVLLYREQGRAIVLSGLPAEPVVAMRIDTTAEALAVSDDAKAVMAVEAAGVRLFDGDTNQWMLNHSEPTSSAIFREASHDAVLAGATGVWLVSSATGNAAAERIWEGDATAAVVDGNAAVLIERNMGLVAVNLRDHTAQRVECSCTPITLARLSQSVYRVNELAEGPLWLVDLNGSTPRAVFVPADAKPEPAEQ
jgi:hypothetical protein